jgi:hypothetical protein
MGTSFDLPVTASTNLELRHLVEQNHDGYEVGKVPQESENVERHHRGVRRWTGGLRYDFHMRWLFVVDWNCLGENVALLLWRLARASAKKGLKT